MDEELTEQQVSDIPSFLQVLTDKNREQYIKQVLFAPSFRLERSFDRALSP